MLTRSLAVLDLTAPLLTGAATVGVGLGADVMMMLFFLLIAQLAVGTFAFVVVSRRT